MLTAKERLIALSDDIKECREWILEEVRGANHWHRFPEHFLEILNLAHEVDKTLHAIEKEEASANPED